MDMYTLSKIDDYSVKQTVEIFSETFFPQIEKKVKLFDIEYIPIIEKEVRNNIINRYVSSDLITDLLKWVDSLYWFILQRNLKSYAEKYMTAINHINFIENEILTLTQGAVYNSPHDFNNINLYQNILSVMDYQIEFGSKNSQELIYEYNNSPKDFKKRERGLKLEESIENMAYYRFKEFLNNQLAKAKPLQKLGYGQNHTPEPPKDSKEINEKETIFTEFCELLIPTYIDINQKDELKSLIFENITKKEIIWKGGEGYLIDFIKLSKDNNYLYYPNKFDIFDFIIKNFIPDTSKKKVKNKSFIRKQLQTSEKQTRSESDISKYFNQKIKPVNIKCEVR